MDTKEIIIDSVDVSECEHLQYKGCNFAQCLIKMASFDLKCEGYNCHYKQLKRAEDKINYMEEYIKTVENARNDLERELKRKEQKLEKIKDYCLKNKVAGWVDIEGIIEIIEGKENEK